jgi:hypothetical protein
MRNGVATPNRTAAPSRHVALRRCAYPARTTLTTETLLDSLPLRSRINLPRTHLGREQVSNN